MRKVERRLDESPFSGAVPRGPSEDPGRPVEGPSPVEGPGLDGEASKISLEASELRYRRLFETARDGILILDAETGEITDVNPYVEELLGYSHDELMGKMLWEIGPLRDVASSQSAFRQLQTNEYIRYENLPLESIGGTKRQVEFVSNVYLVAGKRVIQCNIRDITVRIQAAEDLRKANVELQTVVEDLQRSDQEMKSLNHMNDLLQTCSTQEEAYRGIGLLGRELFRGRSGYLASLGAGEQFLETVATWGDADLPSQMFPLDDCWALRRGQPYEVIDPLANLLCSHVHDPSAGYLCIPLTVHGETLGLLCLLGCPDVDERREHIKLLALTVGEGIKLCLANLRLRAKLREQAMLDPLTGLANRRYVEENLPRELHRSARAKSELGVAMLDLDQFKSFNDRFGHAAGDALLQEVGRVLRFKLRKSDIASRYGGEEFVLVLADCSPAKTFEVVEEIRVLIRDLQIRQFGQLLIPVTVSAGISAAREGLSAQELLREADDALYTAKHSGRDRVVRYEPKTE